MARNKTNMLVDGFGGKVGDQLVLRTRGGRTYLGKMPTINPLLKVTEKQDIIRLKFGDAIRYAKAVVSDPVIKAQYAAAAKPWQTAFNVAFKDAYRAPVISDLRTGAYLGNIGNTILVKVVDNFSVASVTVAISDAAGTILESGPAVRQPNNIDWSYTATQENAQLTGSHIVVTAADRPGNTVTLNQEL